MVILLERVVHRLGSSRDVAKEVNAGDEANDYFFRRRGGSCN